jgi:hypothetical protein
MLRNGSTLLGGWVSKMRDVLFFAILMLVIIVGRAVIGFSSDASLCNRTGISADGLGFIVWYDDEGMDRASHVDAKCGINGGGTCRHPRADLEWGRRRVAISFSVI